MLKKLALIGFALSVASAYAWDKMEGVNKVTKAGVMTATPEWVKDKKDKYDVSFKFSNDSEHSILLFAGDMKCGRGSVTDGTIDNHSDNRTIDLRPKESRSIVLTCRGMDEKQKGDFSITFKVFENPSGDSKTPGKVLAEKLTWKQGATEGKIIK